MGAFDFKNNRAKNLANPIYSKDSVNLRSVKNLLRDFTGNTHTNYTRVQDGVNTYTGGTVSLPTVNISGLTIDNLIVSGESSFNTLSATTISGGTIYSGSTNLYDIFLTTNDGNDITRIQDGLNTFTGGTGNLPTVNISALTIDNLVVSGVTDLGVLSANTIVSGSTNLYDIFLTTNDGNDITRVQGGLNTFTGGTNNLPTVNISALTIDNITVSGVTDLGVLSADTIVSGSTNLYDIFLTTVTEGDITRVSGGTNINTGGTANYPIINLDDNIILNSVSGNSISATTFYSGSTELSTLFGGSSSPKAFITLIDDTTVSWNYSLGFNAKVILTGASGTLAITNAEEGDYGTLKVIQDAVGSRTMSLPANSKVANDGSGAIIFTSNANAIDIISFTYDGTDFLWTSSYNFS